MTRYQFKVPALWRKTRILDAILLISGLFAILGSIFLSIMDLWWFHISQLTPYFLNFFLFFCGIIAVRNYQKEITL